MPLYFSLGCCGYTMFSSDISEGSVMLAWWTVMVPLLLEEKKIVEGEKINLAICIFPSSYVIVTRWLGLVVYRGASGDFFISFI